MALTEISQFTEQLVTAVGIVLGGGWACFKFINGRTFARRAELIKVAVEGRTAQLTSVGGHE